VSFEVALTEHSDYPNCPALGAHLLKLFIGGLTGKGSSFVFWFPVEWVVGFHGVSFLADASRDPLALLDRR